MRIKYYWKTWSPAVRVSWAAVSPTAEEIRAFATQFDPQPFMSMKSGQKVDLRGLCASGWHTCSMAMRLMVDNFLSESSSLARRGWRA